MKRKTTEENFRFIYQYMKRLGELTHKAWNVPNRLTDKDISDLRRLCSLTKCEASTWYQLERYQLEASSRKSRENPDYDEMSGSVVAQLLGRVRKNKMNYFSEELNTFYKEHLIKEEYIVNHINAHRYKGCSPKCLGLARQVLTMACEMARMSMHDDALIFYLETDLTPNAAHILGEDPTRYERLINDLVKLDDLKGRETRLVRELADKLAAGKACGKQWHQLWWKGTEREFEKFIAYCVKKGWLASDGQGLAMKPYQVSPGCHEQLARYVVKVSLGKSGKVAPLRPSDVRKSADDSIGCLQLANVLNSEFGQGFNKSQISKVRGALENR